ncbi:MAG: sensor histidine kinase [Planctomycetota bacterium]
MNVLWFCRLRWIVVSSLAAFGVLCLSTDIAERMGLHARPYWALAAAAVLTLSNLAFTAHARRLSQSGASRGVKANLVSQIVLDLLVLSTVVHFVGSTETYVPFTFLFHIVLACIFFSRPWSLAVTALACVLYALCIAAEQTGIVSASSIYADASPAGRTPPGAEASVLNPLSAAAIWVVVWYLASYLSAMVRQRDHELAETNRQLVRAQEEKARHMLRTTHELKAPFAAIHANAQLLLKGHCGVLPDEALEAVGRVGARCRRLAGEIQDMLQLANLNSENGRALQSADLDLAEVVRWSMSQVRPMAEERAVVVDDAIEPVRTMGVEDHLKMLFINLLANAVTYSNPGGRVRVRCSRDRGNCPVVTVEDHGIGMPAQKLPRIFDEYYRTQEAVRHNNQSSGLGLAIVRQVVQTHGIRLRVQSQPGIGTTFQLWFPPTTGMPAGRADSKESEGGLPADH